MRSQNFLFFFFSSRRRHTRLQGDWSSDVCSSDLEYVKIPNGRDTITAYLAYPERKDPAPAVVVDRKSTRLNSSHLVISYAVFCLKKKNRVAVVQDDLVQAQPLSRLAE